MFPLYTVANLLQCHSSYVVTDPKGTILNEVGTLLDRKGYRIKSLEQPHKISTITGTSKPVTTVRRSNGSKRLV